MSISPGISFFHPDMPEPANPAPADPAVAPPVQPPAEPSPAPEPKLYAGKYKSVDELERGVWESAHEAARIVGENRALKERVEALERTRANPAPEPPNPLAPLEDYGIPPQVLATAIEQVVDRAVTSRVDQRVQQAFAPMVAGMSARNAVSQRYADFSQSENAVANFVSSDPDRLARYNRMSAVDPEGAMEWAYLQHREANPPKRSSAAESPAAAALPQNTPAGARSQTTDNGEELARAQRYYQTYKDPAPYLRARLKNVIPDSFFTEGGG